MKNLRNEQVMERFVRGFEAQNSGKNLTSDGKILTSYHTELARLCGRPVLVNGHKYSSTTSKHQNWLRYNENCVVVPCELYKLIVCNNEDYDVLVNELYSEFNDHLDKDNNLDLTKTTKKCKELVNEVEAYINTFLYEK